MPKFLFITFFLLSIFPFLSYGQYIPLDNYYYDLLLQNQAEKNVSMLSSMKPILQQDLDTTINIENILYAKPSNTKNRNTFIYRKLFNESLIQYKTKEFSISVDPVFNFGIGYDFKESKNTWINTRGISVTGLLGYNLSFNTEIYENQAVLSSWPTEFIHATGVIPGQGAYKPFKETGVDFFYSNGYLSYSPAHFLNMTLGYGKNFIGEGYRSMLLSDASFCYPYFKLTANFKKVKYTIIYDQFIDRSATTSPNFGYDRKWSVMHYLEFMLWGRLKLGVFDAIVWENADSTGYRGFDIQYLNPLILLRPVEESFGSPDNALMGATFGFRINKHFNIYGQLLLDEFTLEHMKANDGWWANKVGIQVGISGWNMLNVPALNARVEYNQATPYTYSHFATIQSYGHYSQPLAHPLGANFREFIAMSSYTRGNWMANIKVIFAMYGLDTAGKDYGKNIFIPYDQRENDYGNKIGQGLKTNLTTTDVSISYLLNRRTNMRIEAGITARKEYNMSWDKQMQYIYFGIRTGLRNIYYDF
ncbi:MAG: hypothetical protein WCI92_17605 [Bacteroidota bacterium]